MTRLTAPHTFRLADVSHDLANGDQPPFLRSLAERSAQRFSELGIPTRQHEEWRLTNVESLAEMTFRLADELPEVTAKQIAAFDIPDLDAPRLVFVNGVYSPALSDVNGLPEAIEVRTLRDSFDSHAAILETHLGRYADAEQDAFTALNTALIGDGLFVHVPKGVVATQPIHVLSVSAASPGDELLLTNPRNLILVDDSAQATIIEDYVSLADQPYVTNAVTEIVVGKNATVEHYLLERESEKSHNVTTLRIEQHASSTFASHSVLLGGKVVRNNIVPVLGGENCDSLLNGLYLTSGEQHMDNHMRVVHAMPHCDSRQFYKGILSDRSTAVFSGRIVVAKDAQKTDAKQSNANLLLSDHCRANTHPQLEIYADDVKCTHGATIGEVDEDAVFYFMARGLSEAAARGLLIHAFAEESIERMKIEPIRNFLETELFKRLPEGKLVRESMQV